MKTCFGTIFPDVSRIQFGRELAGKVFRFRIDSLGAFHRDRHLNCDLKEWADCQSCELYQSCFDFSNAKLTMQRTIAEF